MKDRCFNPNNPEYATYGGRGIKVCERWRNSFENFIADVGQRPSKRHSLDRINNDGDYEPENCRWATRRQQDANRSNVTVVVYRQKPMALRDAVEAAGGIVLYATAKWRIKNGWTTAEAVETKTWQDNIEHQST